MNQQSKIATGGESVGENNNTAERKNNKPEVSIILKSVFGIVILIIVFSVIVSIMGFRNFTDALLDQYSDGAFRTANTAVMEFDVSKIEDYAASGGTTEEYIAALESMERLCNSSGSTFIYVIRPDLSDYKHITFLFSTINENSDYTRYEFGFVRDTTNEEYMEKYRKLYEGGSDQELVIRDKGYIETDPHITAMVPIKDAGGKTTAILCVQRQMDNLVHVRNRYIVRILVVMIALMIPPRYGLPVFLKIVREMIAEAGSMPNSGYSHTTIRCVWLSLHLRNPVERKVKYWIMMTMAQGITLASARIRILTHFFFPMVL